MNQTTWYGSQTEVEPATFGALAVIEPMMQKINLAGIINQHLPADPQAEFDHGAILSMLATARLNSPVALSNVGGVGRTIDTRVIFVFSNVDRKVVLKQRQKHMQRIGDELQQIEPSVAAGRYNDEMTWVKLIFRISKYKRGLDLRFLPNLPGLAHGYIYLPRRISGCSRSKSWKAGRDRAHA